MAAAGRGIRGATEEESRCGGSGLRGAAAESCGRGKRVRRIRAAGRGGWAPWLTEAFGPEQGGQELQRVCRKAAGGHGSGGEPGGWRLPIEASGEARQRKAGAEDRGCRRKASHFPSKPRMRISKELLTALRDLLRPLWCMGRPGYRGQGSKQEGRRTSGGWRPTSGKEDHGASRRMAPDIKQEGPLGIKRGRPLEIRSMAPGTRPRRPQGIKSMVPDIRPTRGPPGTKRMTPDTRQKDGKHQGQSAGQQAVKIPRAP